MTEQLLSALCFSVQQYTNAVAPAAQLRYYAEVRQFASRLLEIGAPYNLTESLQWLSTFEHQPRAVPIAQIGRNEKISQVLVRFWRIVDEMNERDCFYFFPFK